jgi:hypothetical protein
MRHTGEVVVVLGVAALAAGCAGRTTVTTVTAPQRREIGAPRERVVFGYVKSLVRRGDGYELRFDPAWFLSGETANVAAAEDGAVDPGQPVPNDNYVVNESGRAYTYRVPSSARVTVLTRGPDGTHITVARLAELVAGNNPLGRPLFEPLTTGFWLRADIDVVRSLEQQYRP